MKSYPYRSTMVKVTTNNNDGDRATIALGIARQHICSIVAPTINSSWGTRRPYGSSTFSGGDLGVQVFNNFKPHSLVVFNGKSGPQEHIIAIDAKMTIIEMHDSLNFVLFLSHFD